MRSVTASRSLAVPGQRAIEQFLDVSSMSVWWGVSRGLVEPRPGGVWALGWGLSSAGYRYVTSGRIVIYDPGSRLLIAEMVYFNPERPVLGPLQLAITAHPSPGGCRLTVKQDGYQDGPDWDWYHDAVVEAWPIALEALQRHVESASAPGSG